MAASRRSPALTILYRSNTLRVDELSKKHVKANGETADYTRLEGHLNRFVARHTFDYFIHKDVGGFVRQCHGDLHLRNIVLLDGRPTLFDGVEFNDDISCTDVLYDLAFLLMDLWRRRLPRHANTVWTQKRLCGVPRLQRLGPEGYSSHLSERVYSTLADEAARVLRAGHSVVVDAVYARAVDRHVRGGRWCCIGAVYGAVAGSTRIRADRTN